MLGDAGCGKTATCQRLMWLWSRKDRPLLRQFNLILYIDATVCDCRAWTLYLTSMGSIDCTRLGVVLSCVYAFGLLLFGHRSHTSQYFHQAMHMSPLHTRRA